MAVNNSHGEFALEFNKKIAKGGALLRCTRVGGLTIRVETTDIAYADAVGVVPFAMRTRRCEVSAFLDCAIEEDQEMIADVVKAALPMPAADIVSVEVLPRTSGGAMHDDLSDRPFH